MVAVGAGASFGLGAWAGLGCFSGFASPCLACEGGTAGVAGVAGRGAGGLADWAGTAGVARSCVREPCAGFGFGFGGAGGGDAEGSGALAAGGAADVLPPPPVVLLPDDGWPVPGLAGGGVGVTGEGVGVTGEGVGVPGVGAGAGPAGVPPAGPGLAIGPRTTAGAGLLETRIGVKPEKTDGATGFLTACRRAGETSTGTLRTCVLGTASSRLVECSSTVNAWSQSWADATAPAATAPA